MFRDVEVSGSNILFILFFSGGTFPALAGPCDTLGTIPDDGEGGAAAARGDGCPCRASDDGPTWVAGPAGGVS